MAATYSTLAGGVTALKALVRVDERLNSDVAAALTEPHWEDALTRAVQETYSDDRPRHLVLSITGDGSTRKHQLSAVSGSKWRDGWSSVRGPRVEYPAGSTPPYWRADGWRVHRGTDGSDYLYTTGWIVASSEEVEVPYNAPHEIGAAACSVQAGHHGAVLALAAHLLILGIMSERMRITAEEVDAESVDLKTEAERWEKLGKAYLDEYRRRVPLVAPAAVVLFEPKTIGGTDYAFHGRRP